MSRTATQFLLADTMPDDPLAPVGLIRGAA
jgi:hypothetical protein